MKHLVPVCFFVMSFATIFALSQCAQEQMTITPACAPSIPLNGGNPPYFSATPLMDGSATTYEEGFSVQRLIVAQINQAASIQNNDQYSGTVDYNNAPWFDWGPYIWASGETRRSDGFFWCGGQPGDPCFNNFDVREGDLLNETMYWGDFTHPNALGQQKVANQLVKFIQGNLPSPQTSISNWILPWIQTN